MHSAKQMRNTLKLIWSDDRDLDNFSVNAQKNSDSLLGSIQRQLDGAAII